MHVRARSPVSSFPVCFKNVLEERELVGLLTEMREIIRWVSLGLCQSSLHLGAVKTVKRVPPDERCFHFFTKKNLREGVSYGRCARAR